MAKRVKLANGTILEFPDDAPDDVINQVAKAETEAFARRSRDVAALKESAAELSGNPLKAGAQLVTGAFDVTAGGIAGLAEKLEGLGRGAVGAINPNDTYMDARRRTPPPVRDPAPVTPGGRVIANALNTALGVVGVPQTLNATGEGIESLLGPAARDVAGTVTEAATLAVPAMRGRPQVPLAQAVENAERLGYVTPAYAPTGRAGQTAGGAVERAVEGAATQSSEAIKSVVNQNVTDRLAARAGRLDTEYTTPTAIENAVQRAEAPFADIRQTKLEFASDPDYYRSVRDITGSQYNGRGVKLPIDEIVKKLQDALLSARRHTVDSLIDQIGILRSQGFRALGGVDDAAAIRGAAQLKAADALESLMERGLDRAAQRAQTVSPAASVLLQRLIQQYRTGRAWRSDLHIIEESMHPGKTGVIDAHRLARISQRRGGLKNPILQGVAETAHNFPAVTTPLPQASRGAVQTGIGAATRNEMGALGATIGRMLSRTSLRMAQSRRTGSRAAVVRAGTRAAVVGGARAAALENEVNREEE